MSLDVATLRRIARLARIRIDDPTLERLGAELGAIIGWVEQLDEVDIEGVAPMTGPLATTLRLREDRITDGNRQSDILANAPAAAGGYFTVPKVVE
jgi:aspartyl-tRNA(Asn)/glutamyl-tRNA(Gln) amidotransferase subunit C